MTVLFNSWVKGEVEYLIKKLAEANPEQAEMINTLTYTNPNDYSLVDFKEHAPFKKSGILVNSSIRIKMNPLYGYLGSRRLYFYQPTIEELLGPIVYNVYKTKLIGTTTRRKLVAEMESLYHADIPDFTYNYIKDVDKPLTIVETGQIVRLEFIDDVAKPILFVRKSNVDILVSSQVRNLFYLKNNTLPIFDKGYIVETDETELLNYSFNFNINNTSLSQTDKDVYSSYHVIKLTSQADFLRNTNARKSLVRALNDYSNDGWSDNNFSTNPYPLGSLQFEFNGTTAAANRLVATDNLAWVPINSDFSHVILFKMNRPARTVCQMVGYLAVYYNKG